MGKVLWTEDGEQINKTHFGCMSGIFHVLDYQLRHSNVKKIFPHRNHDTIVRHAKRSNRRYKRISDDEDPFEASKLLDPETSHILVDQSYRKTNSIPKSPRLQRTNSIHHLETNEWVHPIIFFPEDLSGSPDRHINVTSSETKDSQDILEMLEVDKEIFIKILHDGSRVLDTNQTNAKLIIEGSCHSSHDEKMESQLQISQDFDLLSTSQDNLEKATKNVNCNNEGDFAYVKQILERSGFIKNGFEQAWYSSNQPLDPFVFQDIESQYFHDPEHLAEDFNELSHRLLVFELVDDVLVTMYERSSTYYPKPLSSSCHICPPTPTGALVLDEVWKRASRLLNLKPGKEQSLNYIVDHDFGSDDGWMNLQLDSEGVALDLEDLIFDQVLEEVFI